MSTNTALLLRELNVAKENEEMWKEIQLQKLAFLSFQVNDLVLMIQRPGEAAVYEAFNKNCPARFLHEESRVAIERDIRAQESKAAENEREKKDSGLGQMFVGQIIMIERHVAGAGPGENPYKLGLGTEFFKLWVELHK